MFSDFAGDVGFDYFLEFEINLAVRLNRSEQVAINVRSSVGTRLGTRRKRVAYGSGRPYDLAIEAFFRRLIIEDSLHVEMRMAGKYVDLFRLLELEQCFIHVIAAFTAIFTS